MKDKHREMLLKIYREAESVEQLPWHSYEPPQMLQKVVGQRARKGRALDIGCGAGIYAVYLARQGYEVTGVDYIDEALAHARGRAREAGVEVELVKADVLQWEPEGRFDLILDAGCFHGMRGEQRWQYRENLMSRLAGDGDYVLLHFEKRHFLDWRPMGPRRMRRRQILDFFAPELAEQEFSRGRKRVPLPVGPVVQIASYWFRRPDKS